MPTITALPTYISLQEAAVRYGVSETVLRRAVNEGAIRAVQLTEGQIAVADEDVAVIESQQRPGVTLPTYIPLHKAVVRYDLSETVLRRAVDNGIIRAVRLMGGKVAVADEDVAVMKARQYALTNGDELVSLSEAARRLEIDSATVWRWYNHGWLPKEGSGPRRAIFVSWNRAQQLHELYKRRGGIKGRRLIPRQKERIAASIA